MIFNTNTLNYQISEQMVKLQDAHMNMVRIFRVGQGALYIQEISLFHRSKGLYKVVRL